MTRTSGGRRTSADDIDGILWFADAFLQNLRAIEGNAIERARHETTQGIGMGAPESVSRNPEIARDFLIQLFGFISAVRTAEKYIGAAVARTSGETLVRENWLQTNIIVFHVRLANQVLHQNLIETARKFHLGGDKDGEFNFTYAEVLLTADAAKHFREIQTEENAKTGQQFSALELADLVVAELRKIDEECRKARYY